MAKTKDAPANDSVEESAEENGSPPSAEDEFLQAQADAAAAQSPAQEQVVPEQRPQAAVTPAPGQGTSEASKRFEGADKPMGQEAFDKASSEKQMKAAEKASRMPNLIDGTRVVVSGDHPEAGRMAYILSTVYKDGVQEMVAKSGTGEARFAEVDHFILRTRDGRSDTFTATPDQVTPLEVNEGWGRGQI